MAEEITNGSVSLSKPSKQSKRQGKSAAEKDPKRGPGRKDRPYPLVPFQECCEFTKFVYDFGSGQKVRRLAAFGKLEKSPESSASRKLITNCNKYALMSSGYAAEHLELTPAGLDTVREDINHADRLRAKFRLSIEGIEAFKFLYDNLNGNKLPNQTVIGDLIKDDFKKVLPEDVTTVVDVFIGNCKYLGLLKVLSGAERLVPLDYCIEELVKEGGGLKAPAAIEQVPAALGSERLSATSAQEFDTMCFYVTPIGEPDSIERKHSDLFLGSIVEPALDRLGLKVVRADRIDKPGTITKQIIQYLRHSKLVIADLSFSNPNVFYELAIRHAFRLPTVQLIRKGDKIPFDVSSSRTIVIDATDIYTLVPKLDSHRAEIANQVRQALEDPDLVDNPLTNAYPEIRLSVSAGQQLATESVKANGN